jgi:ADP-ribose pyrophosphatase YjhB (NUDIX family)
MTRVSNSSNGTPGLLLFGVRQPRTGRMWAVNTMRLRAAASIVGDLVGILRRVIRGLAGGTQSIGGVVIAIDAGRVLLVHARYRRSWTTPGGFLRDGEDPVLGAMRELREEADMEGSGSLVGRDLRRGHTDYVVHAASPSGRARAASWEIRNVGWFLPSELPPLHPVTARLLVGPNRFVDVINDRFVMTSGTVHPMQDASDT